MGETEVFRRKLKQYAITGKHQRDYIFSTMDGTKWSKFLRQFSIDNDNLPELVLLDTDTRQYWQNASVAGIPEFFAAVENGDIAPRKQEKKNQGVFAAVSDMFVDYLPYSLVAMVGLALTVVWLVVPILGEGPIIPPSPPSE